MHRIILNILKEILGECFESRIHFSCIGDALVTNDLDRFLSFYIKMQS